MNDTTSERERKWQDECPVISPLIGWTLIRWMGPTLICWIEIDRISTHSPVTDNQLNWNHCPVSVALHRHSFMVNVSFINHISLENNNIWDPVMNWRGRCWVEVLIIIILSKTDYQKKNYYFKYLYDNFIILRTSLIIIN